MLATDAAAVKRHIDAYVNCMHVASTIVGPASSTRHKHDKGLGVLPSQKQIESSVKPVIRDSSTVPRMSVLWPMPVCPDRVLNSKYTGVKNLKVLHF